MGNVQPVHYKCNDPRYVCTLDCLVYNEKLRKKERQAAKRAAGAPQDWAVRRDWSSPAFAQPKTVQATSHLDPVERHRIAKIEKAQAHIARLQAAIKSKKGDRKSALAVQIQVHTERLDKLKASSLPFFGLVHH